MTGVLLINPKYAHNVGAAFRACAAWGVPLLRWTGTRMDEFERINGRLPREERMRQYKDQVDWECMMGEPRPITKILSGYRMTPVCVEVGEGYETLPDFGHPENALYVFGPEDGSVPRPIKQHCHRFVSIPTHVCLNLAAAVNVVLYDRQSKAGSLRLEDTLWKETQ